MYRGNQIGINGMLKVGGCDRRKYVFAERIMLTMFDRDVWKRRTAYKGTRWARILVACPS